MLVEETYVILFGIYVKRNNCIVKTIFIVCLLLLGGWPRHDAPLITPCYSPFLCTFIYLTRFHSVPIFNGFVPLVIIDDITCVC